MTRLPEQNSWNLSIQRQLTGSLVLDLAYNGVAGSHLQNGLLNYNQVPFQYAQRFTNAQLGLRFNDPAQAAQIAALGVQLPYANFVKNFGSRATLAQALRPYPQYTDINTWDGNGDHSGHSTYHAGVIKLEKRYAAGLAFTTSYVFSKMLTDADTYWITDNPRAADQGNRRLEKSIGSYDVTHNFKLGLTYELPFGPGKKWMSSGFGSQILGGWRISSINLYSSGRPVAISADRVSASSRAVPRRSSPVMRVFNPIGRMAISIRMSIDSRTSRSSRARLRFAASATRLASIRRCGSSRT